MKKSLLLVVFFCFASLIFAGAKSYPMTIAKATKVGGSELAKGFYTVKLDGEKAIFTDAKKNETSVSGKVTEGTGKKYEMTSVETSEKTGSPVIKVIHFAGSNTTIEFAD